MRTIILLLLAAFCTSCATTYTAGEYPRILFHDGRAINATLLLQTDTVLVVDMLCQSWSSTATKCTMGLCAIPNEAIRSVWFPERRKEWEYTLIGAAVGAGAGTLIGAVSYEKPKRKPGQWFYIDVGWEGAAIIGAVLLVGPATVIGFIAGVASSASERAYDPAIPESANLIRKEIGVVYLPRYKSPSWTFTPAGSRARE